MGGNFRRRFFVDPAVQGAILLRVVSYWLLCVLAIGLIMLACTVIGLQVAPWGVVWNRTLLQFAPALIAALAVLPIMIVDCIHLTHRFAGPVVRLRRVTRQLAEGCEVEHLQFRKGDFWKEWAEEFNRLAARMSELQQEVERLRAGTERQGTMP